MDPRELARRLRQTFAVELDEQVRALGADLLELERHGGRVADPAALEVAHRLFRAAHTLKGAARAVSLEPVETACHHLEALLAQVRDGERALDADAFAVVFAAVDGLASTGAELEAGHNDAGEHMVGVGERLAALVAGGIAVAQRTAPGPPAAEPGGVLPVASVRAGAPVAPLAREPVALPTGRASRGSRRAAARSAAPTGPPDSRTATGTPGAGADAAGPLPASAPLPPSASAPPPSAPPPSRSVGDTGAPSTPRSGATMRVRTTVVDAAVARSGELRVARAQLGESVAVLTEVHAHMAGWRAELRRGDRGADTAGNVRERVERAERQLAHLSTQLGDLHRRSENVAELLDTHLRRLRMLPFAEACLGLDRVVRDLATAGGKEVDLAVDGGEVELDRDIVEGLRAPLLHLVRNAVDHGIEPADTRRADLKPARGRIEVAARLLGSEVVVTVADDGAGVDQDALATRARQRGVVVPAGSADLLALAFVPGVSTSTEVTAVSGRGVGLDAVRAQVEALHGTVAIHSTRGRGAGFVLTMPVTLTSMRALLVAAAGQVFAVATTAVKKVVRFSPESDLRRVSGREVLAHGGELIPISTLTGALGLPPSARLPGARATCVLLRSSAGAVAVAVDEALAEEAIVTKGLGARVKRSRSIAGAAILPGGRLALVLRAGALARAVLGAPAAGLSPRSTEPAVRRRILVVDDSLTTRTLVKTILEAVGYQVTAAADGAEAWRIVQERGVDLVVSDVEMPRLDGLGLCEAIRSSPRHRALPVVLVTALGSDGERAQGLQAGADAYLVKSAFDQSVLIETLAQLLGPPT